jgi:outer membrane protein assembly factor BamB
MRRPNGGTVASTTEDAPDDAAIFFPTDRAVMQILSRAKERLKEERLSEAVRLLSEIPAGPEDYFFQPDKRQQVFRSMKTEAQRLIGELPPAGRESYETQFGAQARQMLDRAVDAGDADGLAEVARRFFHTRAGYEATELLGTLQMEEGRPLPAALLFKRLTAQPSAVQRFEPLLSTKLAICWARAGNWREATNVLLQLRNERPDAEVLIAGKPRKLLDVSSGKSPLPAGWSGNRPTPEEQLALAWLQDVGALATPNIATGPDQWLVYRGSVSRNAISSGSDPLLNRRWAVPLAADPGVERIIESLRQTYNDQSISALPSIHPLAVNEQIFSRSVSGVVCVDFKTGKRVWYGPVDDSARSLLDSTTISASSSTVTPNDGAPSAGWLDRRVWDDYIYGTLSSDGHSIFAVEDLSTPFGFEPRTVFQPNGRIRGDTGNVPHNRLVAYSIPAEGKLEWELGGRGASDPHEFDGAFFLGPPLPLAGRLYVLAEIKGEVRLLALRARQLPNRKSVTIEVEWSQQLAMLENNIANDPLRRMAGAMPSFADGVMVCPTSAGAIVAVDLSTRSLLWGYRYRRAVAEGGNQGNWRGMNLAAGATNSANRWTDAVVTIASGRVLVTPVESDDGSGAAELHCLDLLEGKQLWKQPREDGQYVACVEGDHVVVVGGAHVRQYQLSDGKPGWTLTLPSGAIPSGRGFSNAQHYYLPLTSAEVVAIRLADGKIESRARSRSGNVPGNLISYHGAIISQSSEALECFYQLDELKHYVTEARLEKPDDPTVLTLEAELALEAGRLDEALQELRKSLALRPSPRTRQLLVEALLEGLKTDFARYRSTTGEIEQLVDQPTQQLAYLRQLADSLRKSGELMTAFETYLRILDEPATSDDGLERIDSTLSVRRERWTQARLRELFTTLGPQDKPRVTSLLQQRLDKARAAESPEPLQQFVRTFAPHELAYEALDLLATRLASSATPLEMENMLRRLEIESPATLQRGAVARMAKLLSQSNRPDEAASYLARLEAWGNEVCLNGQTGSEIAKELRAVTTDDKAAAQPSTWPTGVVTKEPVKGQNGVQYRIFPVDLRGSKGPFFARTALELDQQTQALILRNGTGQERWRTGLAERGDRLSGWNPSFIHARVNGHLLVASVGQQLIALDTLGSAGKGAPRIIWRQDLGDAVPGFVRQQVVGGRLMNVHLGMQRAVALDMFGRPIGTTGPLTADVFCFQRQRHLMAVNPLTGQTLWTRRGVSPGSDLFGDDELIFVMSPGSDEATVYSAIDGQELGRRKAPSLEQQLMRRGRCILIWQQTGNRGVLKYRDIWSERDLWQRTFTNVAKPWPIEDEAVAVLEPSGKFVILDAIDGREQLVAEVPAEKTLNEIYVLRSADRDILITNNPWTNREGANVQPIPGMGFSNPLISGQVHGFNRATGKRIFTTPVEGRSLLLHQPAELPIITFAAQIYRPAKVGRENSPQVAVLCIDKRHGRIVLDEKSAGPVNNLEISGDPTKAEVLIRTIRGATRLTFTADAWPEPTTPVEDKKPPVESSLPTRAGKALFRGMKDWLDSLPSSTIPLDPLLPK